MGLAVNRATFMRKARSITSLLASFGLLVSLVSAIAVLSPLPIASATTVSQGAFDFNTGASNTVMKTADGTRVIPASTDFTVEAWVYVDTNTGGWQTILVQDQAAALMNAGRFYLGFYSGRNLHIGVGSQSVNTTVVMPLQTWTHVAVSVDRTGASTRTITYINGSPVYTWDYTSVDFTAAQGFAVGLATDGGYELDGKVDQVKIWNGALSAIDIATSQTAYAAGGISSGTLAAHYDFNEGTGSTINDRSGNGLNLSLTTGNSVFTSSSNPPSTTSAIPTTVAGTAGNSQVALTWAAPNFNGGASITGYTVTSSPSVTAPAGCTNTANLSCTYSGLTNGTAYTFTVVAINSKGNSAASTASSSVTPITTAGAPTSLSATVGNSQVALSWTAPTSNGGSAITDYLVQYSTDGTNFTTFADGVSTTPSATVTGLVNGTAYTFRVSTVTSFGTGTGATVSPTPFASCSPASSVSGGFTTLTFTSSTTCFWSVPAGVTAAHVVAVGGGGGGGADGGGGGGGGGVYENTNLTVTPNAALMVAIGQGGAGGNGYKDGSGNCTSSFATWSSTVVGCDGARGAKTFFGTISASGGGGGGGIESSGTTDFDSSTNARGGGGGAGAQNSKSGTGSAGVGGFTGGSVTDSAGNAAGGGAGAGASGSASSGSAAGAGGAGVTANVNSIVYGSGGGGGSYNNATAALGGTSAANGGSQNAGPTTPTANRGGGGGGGGNGGTQINAVGSTGAAGVVIVKYLSTYTITYSYNGADAGNSTSSTTFNPGGTALTLPTPTKTGFAFSGWYTASSGGSLVGLAGASYTPSGTTAAITLEAQWGTPSGTTSVPSAPDSVTASGSNGGITLTWAAPISLGGKTISNYQVEYSTTGAANSWTVASSSIASNATSYAITGLAGNASYYVRVAALFSGGRGAYGYPWRKAYGTQTSTRSSNAIVYQTGYGLAVGDAASSISAFTRVRYLMKATYGATPTAYYTDVDFAKGLQNASSSNTTNYTLDSASNIRIPSLVTGQQFIVQGDVYDLTVLSNVDSGTSNTAVQNGFGFNGRVEIWPWDYTYAPASGLTSTTRSSNTVFDDADSTPGNGSYGSFQLHNIATGSQQTVFAWNNHGATPEIAFGSNTGTNSDWTFCSLGNTYGNCASRTNFSLEIFVNAPITAGIAPGAPTGVTATAGNAEATIAWSAPSSNGGSSITGYSVTSSPSVTAPAGCTNTLNLSCTFTGLTNGTAYTFTVVAINAIGNSTGATASATPTGPALTPTFGSTTATTTGFTVQISNYSASYTWAGTATANGIVSISGTGLVTVTGVAGNTASTATITTTRTGYTGGSATVSATSLVSSYTITLTAGTNGTGGNQTLTKTNGTDLTLPNSSTANGYFTRTGYTVTGWSTTNGGSQTHALGGAFTTEAATTLYPVWTANSNNFAYDGNGSDGGSTPTGGGSKSYGSTITVDSNSSGFTRTGYTFVAWNTAANGTGTQYVGSATFTMPDSSVTLYAQWTKIKATGLVINLDANNPQSLAPSPSTSKTWVNALPGTSVSSQTANGNITRSTANGVTQFNFDGNADSFQYATVADTRITGAMTLEMWVNPTTLNNGWNIMASRWFADAAGNPANDWHFAIYPTGGSLKLNLYTTGKSNMSGNFVFTTNKWYLVGFTIDSSNNVQFFVNGQTDGSVITGASHTANISSLLWIGDGRASAVGFIGGISKFRLYNTALTSAEMLSNYDAEYSTYSHAKVTFSANYGVSPTTSVQYLYKSTSTALTANAFTRTGYTFAGWNTVADGSGTPYTNSASVSLSGDTTLFAQWTAGNNTVIFNANGGSGTMTNQTIVSDSATALTSNTFTRTGYTFGGWNTNADGTSGTSYTDGQSVTITAGMTVYAKWTAGSNTVVFDANGGSGTMSNQTITTATATALTSNAFTRSNYTFAGWTTAANGTGTAYTNGQSVTITAGMTLYAKWTGDSKSITYAAGGGTGSAPSSPTSVEYGSTFSAPANTYTRPGYSFAGWSDGSSTYAAAATYPSAGTVTAGITLTATWTAISCTVSTSSAGGYTTLTFSTVGSCIWNTPSGVSKTSVLVVGGGGGGGGSATSRTGGSGGAGGVFTNSTVGISGDILVTVGSGGAGSTSTTTKGVDGGNSTFGTLKVGGGGAGNGESYPTNTTASAGLGGSDYVSGGNGGGGRRRISGDTAPNAALGGAAGGYASSGISFLGTTYVGISGVVGGDAWTGDYASGGLGGQIALANRTSSLSGSSVAYAKRGTFRPWDSLANTEAPQTYGSGGAANYNYGGAVTGAGGAGSQGVVILKYASVVSYSYDANGGTGSAPASGSAQGGTSFTTAANPFTRSNYTFTGWNTAADGSGTALTENASNTLPVSGSAVVIYAQWRVSTNTITFNAGTSGSGTMGNQTVTHGVASNLNANLYSRANYVFYRWATNSDGTGTTYSNLAQVTLSASTTLYAQWTANTYVVTYNYNGADGGNSTTTASYTSDGSAITLPTPTKTGYTFAGWHSDAALTSQIGSGGGSGNYSPTGSVLSLTAYAKWTAENYTFTYNGNSADSGTVPTETSKQITQTVIVKANTGGLTRGGYTFAGWNTQSNGGGTNYLSGSTYTVGSSNVTLYAKWSANTYRVTYNVNSGTGSGQRSSSDVAYDDYTTGSTSITLPSVGTLLRAGYTFGGWNTSADGTGTTYLAAATYTTASNTILYAKWNPVTYSITYDGNGKDGGSAPTPGGYTTGQSSPYSVLANSFTLTSHIFGGWNTASDKSGTNYSPGASITTLADITLYAIWIPQYTLHYAINGGSVTSGVLPADTLYTTGTSVSVFGSVARTGYTFDGWLNGSTTISPTGSFSILADSVLTAKWTPIDYTISYQADGGSTTPSSSTKQIGQSYTVAPAINKPGHNFTGWSNGSSVVGAGAVIVMGSSHVTYTAQWTAQIYTISYDWNGGRGTAVSDVNYTYGTTAITLPLVGDRVKDGYTFAGWSESSNGSALNATYIPSQTRTLYALWNIGNFTVTYDPGRGTLANTTVAVQNGSSTVLPLPTRANFTFNGWHTAVNGGSSVGSNGATFTPSGSQTVYARWIQNSLYGITDSLSRIGSVITSSGNSNTFSGANSNSSVAVSIPADALPAGTTINFDLVSSSSRATGVLSNINYLVSIALSWLTGDETVPDTAAGKPISMTISNASIKAGASAYAIVNNVSTLLGTATQDGVITVSITSDPEIVVVATKPGAPTNVAATSNGDQQSVVSWSAPTTDGGSAVTGYTVAVSPSVTVPAGCTNTTNLSCTFTGLTNGTSYTFTVTATNTVGTSVASSAASASTASVYAVTFNSKGGTTVSNGSFLTASTVSEPTAPTKTGYTFAGWSATDGGSAVTFPYAPGVTTAITMYALWDAVINVVTFDSKGGTSVVDGSFASGGTVSAPTAPTKSGYTFAGWSATDGGSAVTFPYAPGVVTDITLYAKWTVVSQSSSGGGGGSSSSSTPSEPSTPSTPVKSNVTVVAPVTVVGDQDAKVIAVEITTPATGSTVKPPVIKVDKASEKFIAEVKVVEGKLVLTPETGFSGKKTVTVTITENGTDRFIQIPLTVLPEAVTKPVVTPASATKSIIRWTESPNADGYTVLVNGKKVCSTTATSCSISKVLGPDAVIEVISNGGDRTVSEKIEADFKQNTPVQITRLVSSTNIKSTLSSVDTKALDKVIALIRSQGFGTIVISNITTTKKTEAAAAARIVAIKKYIDEKTGSRTLTFDIVPASSKTYFNNIALKG